MGCNQSCVEPCDDAKRLALLTDFTIAMKEKLDEKDTKYQGRPYTIHELADHFNKEVNEFWIEYLTFKHADSTNQIVVLHNMEKEAIDVANMAFLIREECIRLRSL
jgi:hypothetical protein